MYLTHDTAVSLIQRDFLSHTHIVPTILPQYSSHVVQYFDPRTLQYQSYLVHYEQLPVTKIGWRDYEGLLHTCELWFVVTGRPYVSQVKSQKCNCDRFTEALNEIHDEVDREIEK